MFERTALELFHWQREHNPVYATYLRHLGKPVSKIQALDEIPFLPIEVFKSHEVRSGNAPVEKIFTSSGTSGSTTSRHFVADVSLYEQSYFKAFELFYGHSTPLEDWCILALLPGYLERSGSSLIEMVDGMIRMSSDADSGFFLNEFEQLSSLLAQKRKDGRKVLLIGVTFALLDFAERYRIDFPELIVMETGGMKGRRKELTREEVHALLKPAFGVQTIHSEYGMTELLSQAYSRGEGRFACPPWMKILLRETDDPFKMTPPGRTGAINVIDLANVHSCAFLATSDLGRMHVDGTFEVLGRFDHSDVRGCNLMVQ